MLSEIGGHRDVELHENSAAKRGKAKDVAKSIMLVPSPQPIADDLCGSDTQPRNVISSEPGQLVAVPQGGPAGLAEIRDDQRSSADESLGRIVATSGVDHHEGDNLPRAVDPALVMEIREQWRRRQAWHRAEKSLTLQAKALCRRLVGGDKAEAEKLFNAAYGKGQYPDSDLAFAATFPLIEARNSVAKHRAAVEKRLEKLAKQLPVWPFVEGTRGVGPLGFAGIVGEAGDLLNYSTVAKLWKRMGLAVMPDGRQRRVSGEAAIAHGYSPGRRSHMWNIGACFIKAKGPLKDLYDERKLLEAERVETKAHAHNRAQRYIEKRFLRELWSAWRQASSGRNLADANSKSPIQAREE